MSDWEGSEDGSPVRPIPIKAPATKSKWEGEDEDDDGPVSDWEASSDEEESAPAAAPVAPPKKKGTLKQKIAEKEAARQALRAAEGDSPVEYDEDAVLDPRAKARLEKERELESDLHHATELFGSATVKGSSDADLDKILKSTPKTKEDFIALSDAIIAHVVKQHQDKPLYATFVEHHVRALAAPLRDVDVRKAATGLTTLANEKQREQRDKASGKKRPKATGKPVLGASKLGNKLDTTVYDEALDDFGTNPDDFM
ncbi:translation initiation factor eIF3 subunit [Lactifluus subvellereus]|nr:translation initiation factor eIF3 subunit [Lactifluus subvellereus]